MTTQDFGLSFTIESPILWNDTQQGNGGPASTLFAQVTNDFKQGGASTIFSDLVAQFKQGGASTIFADLISQTKDGPASSIDATHLCDDRSILNTPLTSVLNGPLRNRLSCNDFPFLPTSLLIGLEMYFKFNNDGLDSSDNGRDLVFTGTEQYNPGLFNDGYEILGTSSHADRGVYDGSIIENRIANPWAYQIWVNLNSLPGNQYLICKGNPSAAFPDREGWHIHVTSAGAVVYSHHQTGGGSYTTADGLISSSAGWQHVVVTSDTVTERIYVDGVLALSDTALNAFVDTNIGNLRIGALFPNSHPTSYPSSVDGLIDEVAVWSRNLTEIEVVGLYNNGIGEEFPVTV